MAVFETEVTGTMVPAAVDFVGATVREGLQADCKWLPPWLFYDEAGSLLFEQITTLPEYYLTRTERGILAHNADAILDETGPVSVVELGAGTATKTGLLLRAAAHRQGRVLYQPIDVSSTALDEARRSLEADIDGVVVLPVVANYITESIRVVREAGYGVLALYIGSSIGNFSPEEARGILTNLRAELRVGDFLLLGTDLAPDLVSGGTGSLKSEARLVAAYDDPQGVTAAFNLNMLARLNREVGTDFKLDCFQHEARWNASESRMEMHLKSKAEQVVTIPAGDLARPVRIHFAAGETIHTENSYKFSLRRVAAMLEETGFGIARSLLDDDRLFVVTLAEAVGQ